VSLAKSVIQHHEQFLMSNLTIDHMMLKTDVPLSTIISGIG
jgi:hypothetical protein